MISIASEDVILAINFREKAAKADNAAAVRR